MTTNPDALHLRGVTKRYDGHPAVDGIDLTIPAGARVALLGLNGAGKTTTISMVLGLTRPDEGEVRVFGRTPRDAVRDGVVAAMLQSARIPPRATVSDVVRLATRLYADATPLPGLLALADLTHLARRRVEKLSGGEVQRVKFAIAAAGRPQLLMLDEPTTAMDVPSRRAFWTRMRAYSDAGRTVVYCTHLLDEAADADRIVVLRAGRVVAEDTPDALVREADATSVSVTATVADVDRLPGLVSVSVQETRTTIRTTDPDAVVYELARRGLVQDLRVTGGDLGAAFLRLAGDPATSTEPMETLS